MIAPGIEMVDFDPDGFAHVCSLLSRRERTRPELHVLHDSGRVLRVVHTERGTVGEFHESFDDSHRRAAEILVQSDVSRVILADRSRLGVLGARIDALGTREATQAELLWGASETFWSHPAIATSPDPPRRSLPALYERLLSLGDDWWGVLGAWREEELAVSVVARFEAGAFTYATSAAHRYPRAEALRMIEAVESQGPVRVALLCDVDSLDRILLASDPIQTLRTETVIFSRGIEVLT